MDEETKQMIADLHSLFKPLVVSNNLKKKPTIKELVPKVTADFIINHNKKFNRKK